VPDAVPTDGGRALAHNPFAALPTTGLKAGPGAAPPAAVLPAAPARHRGRVDITREKGGRGGKTVTVVDGFTGIGRPEKEGLVKKIRGACGCGGTVKDGRIEIQGDQRETVARILSEAGFRPVFAGG
jgi:translation initiation factor 1